MKTIRITKEAHAAIRGAAVREFADLARPIDDPGLLDVPIEAGTLARLEAVRLPGETLSDAIVRVVTIATKGAN